MTRDFAWSELIAALVVCAFGAAAVWVARDYSFGTITRMGAGFVPSVLGLLIAAMGAVLALQSRSAEPVEIELHPRPFVLMLGGILAWALLVERIGFVVATFVLVACCALAEPRSTIRSTLLLATALTAGGYLIFVIGLKIPLPAFGN